MAFEHASDDPLFKFPCPRNAQMRRCCMFFAYCLDRFIRKGLGYVLCVAVIGLVSFVFGTGMLIVLPYEMQWLPAIIGYSLILFATYLVVNIFYHYFKAATTASGRPVKSYAEPLCRICRVHKSIQTHHCSICGECVVNMDHHCVWINRCVGAGNHRFFLQFIAFLSLGCLMFLVFGVSSFYYNYWAPQREKMFCHMQLDFVWVPGICSLGDEFVSTSIFFSYCLTFIVFLLVGGLFTWNFLLISNNKTYIGILKGAYENDKSTWKRFMMPCGNAQFWLIWNDFLGLNHGRTFWRHIALPSSHRPNIPLHWDDECGPDAVRLLDI